MHGRRWSTSQQAIYVEKDGKRYRVEDAGNEIDVNLIDENGNIEYSQPRAMLEEDGFTYVTSHNSGNMGSTESEETLISDQSAVESSEESTSTQENLTEGGYPSSQDSTSQQRTMIETDTTSQNSSETTIEQSNQDSSTTKEVETEKVQGTGEHVVQTEKSNTSNSVYKVVEGTEKRMGNTTTRIVEKDGVRYLEIKEDGKPVPTYKEIKEEDINKVLDEGVLITFNPKQ